MWRICQDSELATAINYQRGDLGALNMPDGWSFYLCARYHMEALRSLMTPLTYTLRDGERGWEAATDMLFASLLKFAKIQTGICSNGLLEFPVGANVREDCLWRSGQESMPKDYQLRRESAYRIRWCLDRSRSEWVCLGDFLLLFPQIKMGLKVEMVMVMMILTISSKWGSYHRSKDNFNHFWKTLKMTSCTFVQLEECRHIFHPRWDLLLIRTLLKGMF